MNTEKIIEQIIQEWSIKSRRNSRAKAKARAAFAVAMEAAERTALEYDSDLAGCFSQPQPKRGDSHDRRKT